MTNVNMAEFQNNLSSYLKSAINFNDVIGVNTSNGRAIVISEDEYSGLLETLYLSQYPGTMEEIQESLNNLDNEDYWVSEKEFDW